MKTRIIAAAAAGLAAVLGFVAAVALPASAAPAHGKRAAFCAALPHAVTDGTHTLAFYARRMNSSPVDVLMMTGFCAPLNRSYPGTFHDLGGFRVNVPAGILLYGPL